MSWYYETPVLVDIPGWLFAGHTHLDLASAVKADVSLQRFTVVPRHFYIDATFRCLRCHQEFCFTVVEQKYWYEDCRFTVNSYPRRCPACRRELRRRNALRQEYDHNISATLRSPDCAAKQRLIDIIDELREVGIILPQKTLDNRQRLAAQIARLSKST